MQTPSLPISRFKKASIPVESVPGGSPFRTPRPLHLTVFQIDTDRPDRFHSVSASIEKITGISADQLQKGGQAWLDLIHQDDRQAVLDARKAVIHAKEHGYSIQYRFVLPDGGERWLEESGNYLGSDGHGGIIRGLIDDITDRLQEIQNLRESEAKYRELMERAGDAIIAADAESGIILEINQKACELFGYSREELVGKHQRELHPKKFRSEAEELFRTDAAHTPDGGIQRISWVQGSDGNDIPVEISAGVVYVQGKKILQGIFRDLRERLRSEERRLAAEKKFRAVVENSLMGIYIIQKGRFTYVNPQFAEIFGYTEAEMLALPSVLDIVAKADKALVRENLITRIPREITKIHYQFRGKRKDGQEILLEVHGSQIGHNGDTSIMGTLLDITERVSAEDALRVSERNNRQLVEQSPIGIMKADASGVLTLVNPRICSMLGHSADELIGNTVFATYHPDEIEAGRKRMEALESGKEARFERRLRRKDGSYIFVDVSLIKLENGSWQAMFIDVTQRKQSEDQLRKLSQAVEQSPVSIVVTDTTGAIEYVNPKFTQVTQYTFEEVFGKNSRLLKSGYTSAAEYERLWKTISSGGTWNGELQNKKKNGDLYWEDAVISPIRDADGTITHFLGVKEDITARKMMENQMLHAQRMESLGTLAGGIAHDLNNVLTPILLSLQAIQKRISDPAALKLLQTVEKSANRGKDIVRQVLTFARAGAGERDTVDVSDLLAEIRQLIQETFPKNIDLAFKYPRDLRNILADRTQIHQVLMNLCVNARDAMQKGGELGIDVKNIDLDASFASMQYGAHPGPFILIEVSDTGSGIPKDLLTKIFEPFFTTKEVGSGTGLGLSTVHTIVKNHSGFIRVRSKQREGTRFSVYLPAQAVSAKSGIAFSEDEGEAPAGHGETILIVDDEPSILESARAILEAHGYDVQTALDGTEAITVFSGLRKTIRLALVDLMMPYMDGVATVRSLSKMNPGLAILASSGALMADEKWQPVDEFITAYIPKPYTASALLKSIGTVLKSHTEPLKNE